MESLGIFVMAFLGVGSAAVCSSFKWFNGKRYCLVDVYVTWENASAICSGIGGGLAVPNSLSEQTFLLDFAAGEFGESNVMWIDCKKMSADGEWLHADGSQCEYNHWRNADPVGNYIYQLNCGQMYLYSGEWFASECDKYFYVACEFAPIDEYTERPTLPMVCQEINVAGRLQSTE